MNGTVTAVAACGLTTSDQLAATEAPEGSAAATTCEPTAATAAKAKPKTKSSVHLGRQIADGQEWACKIDLAKVSRLVVEKLNSTEAELEQAQSQLQEHAELLSNVRAELEELQAPIASTEGASELAAATNVVGEVIAQQLVIANTLMKAGELVGAEEELACADKLVAAEEHLAGANVKHNAEQQGHASLLLNLRAELEAMRAPSTLD